MTELSSIWHKEAEEKLTCNLWIGTKKPIAERMIGWLCKKGKLLWEAEKRKGVSLGKNYFWDTTERVRGEIQRENLVSWWCNTGKKNP